MIPIYIDTSSILDEFPSMEEDIEYMIDYVVKEVTERFAEEWQNEALRTLRSTKAEYAKSIIVVDSGWLKGAVVLKGELPNAIENGASPYDMKEGLLNGPNAKVKNGVRYNTVPFRQGNPEAVEDSELFSNILPKSIHSIIKAKPQNIPTYGGVRTEGIKVSELPQAYREPDKKSAPKGAFGGYQRKFPIQAGVTRVKDKVTGQNKYISFRRVSDNSDDDAWIHSGFEARNLADTALDNLQTDHIVGQSVDDFLTQNGYA